MNILLLILGIILFIGLVVAHEFGHFIFARRNGVEAEEFGIGFPPKMWGKKIKSPRGDYLFTLNWLPLGGFVRLKGEHDADTEPGTFGAASLGVKTKIMAAGVGMNLLVAFLLFMVLAWIGMPRLIDNQFTVASDTKIAKHDILVGFVQTDSPAAKAGLQVSDKLVSMGEVGKEATAIASAEGLPEVTKKYAGKEVIVNYVRHGASQQARVQLLDNATVEASKNSGEQKAYLGVSPSEYMLQRSTWSAPIVSLGIIKQFTVLTFQGLGTAIGALFQGDTAKASEQVSGPVGVFAIMKSGSLLGFQFVLMIVAVISLSLAIINILPIPALDGGKLFMTYISRLMGKKISENVENWAYGASFLFLIGLMVLITIVDVRRFF